MKVYIHGVIMKLLYYNPCPKKQKKVKAQLDKGETETRQLKTKSITPQNRTRALNNRAAQGWTNLETSGICIKVCGGIIKARVGDFLTNNK